MPIIMDEMSCLIIAFPKSCGLSREALKPNSLGKAAKRGRGHVHRQDSISKVAIMLFVACADIPLTYVLLSRSHLRGDVRLMRDRYDNVRQDPLAANVAI